MQHTSRLAILATALLAVGCADTPGAPNAEALDEAQLTLDVAAFAADATVDDIQLMTAEADLIMGGPLAVHGLDELTVTRQVTFFGVDGEMEAFHPLDTESIHILFAMEGSRTRIGDHGTVTYSVSRERDVTVSGLLGEETERTWNGTGAASRNRALVSDENGDREYAFSSTTEIDAVVIPVPRGSGWPSSGTISREVTVEVIVAGETPRTRQRTVQITFNGTNLVPIVINGEAFTLDLETREIIAGAA